MKTRRAHRSEKGLQSWVMWTLTKYAGWSPEEVGSYVGGLGELDQNYHIYQYKNEFGLRNSMMASQRSLRSNRLSESWRLLFCKRKRIELRVVRNARVTCATCARQTSGYVIAF